MDMRDVTLLAQDAFKRGLVSFDALCEGLTLLGSEDVEGDEFHIEECFERIFDIPRATTRSLRLLQRHQHNQPNHAWELFHEDLRTSKARFQSPEEPTPQPTQAGRYILGNEIGRGGSGRVLLAQDRDLGRMVALKVPRPKRDPDEAINRFLREAQATGQLQHPNIVPLYDLGFLPDGSLFYSMKYVGQDNLRSVIHALKYQQDDAVQHYTLTRLLSIFNQVCMAVDYAHAQGIIHRDLKPENILLGEHGEVIVMDWGLARYFRDDKEDDVRSASMPRSTPIGTVIGTPEYMAPEQAMGAGRFPAVDIYSLGVVLYELLCLTPPFESSSPMQTLLKIVREKPIPPSFRAKERQRHVPTRLEEICLKAMAKDPKDRHASARQLRDEIEDFLDNRRSVERLQQRAEQLTQHARDAAGRYSRLRDAVEEAQDIYISAKSDLEGWEPMEQKRAARLAAIERNALLDSCLQAFSEAESHFLQALAFSHDSTETREALTQLYCQHFQFCERIGHPHQAKRYHTLALSYDNGRLSHLLQGRGFLSFQSDPPEARLDIFALHEEHGVLSPGQHIATHQSPTETTPLPMGRYLARVDYPNAADTLLAFRIQRNAHVALNTTLVMQHALPPGFAYIPEGTTEFGGDPDALRPLPKHSKHIPAFLIAHYPITFGEYLEFINDLHKHDPERALHHLPRTPGTGILCTQTPDGIYTPSERLLFGLQPQHVAYDESSLWILPVCGVSFFDAVAYTHWRSQRDNRPMRLPTQHEWERAARSNDQRLFPWGDAFDPTLCKMTLSRPGPTYPEPVGSFTHDVSPHNVCDLAGGVHEWTCDLFSSQLSTPETESSADLPRVCKGGSWESGQHACRAASRKPVLPTTRSRSIGFRLAVELQV